MKTDVIKTGFLVSYDWSLLKHSLPCVYDHSDRIFLALDKHRITWSGNLFDFDLNNFQAFLRELDKENKIEVFEESFYKQGLSPMECEVRERNLLASKMGKGGWHIQLDVDEYFRDFGGFVKFLRSISANPKGDDKALNVLAHYIPLFKKLRNGYLFVENGRRLQSVPVATNTPEYQYGRVNGHFNITSSFYIVHETWARSEEDVLMKISNWGHRDDFNKSSYIKLWNALDEYNHKYLRNFYYLAPREAWAELSYSEGKDIGEFLEKFSTEHFPYSKLELFLKNNRNVARFLSLIRHARKLNGNLF
ncbi:hypothetical protein [uncultured Imperialibacter sp.]|uniref:hypothetical protein n=1 Tax=uncultured Imperialibacter sp. TaxID=1672639 RepID=UPI0030D93C79